MNAIDLAAAWHVATRELLGVAAGGIAVSALDDVAIDLIFLALLVFREVAGIRAPAVAAAAHPGWMAIVIPAWDEADVIGAMLADLTQRLDYPCYRVFVGVYPNDPATRAAIDRVADPRIVVATCSRAGPTTKADCLNHLWRAAVAHEAAAGITFKALILHDAEDCVDPAELSVFDAHIPRLAMVQLPVVALPDRASRWVSGHYPTRNFPSLKQRVESRVFWEIISFPVRASCSPPIWRSQRC